MKSIDLTGRKFGRLTATQKAENVGGRVHWTCVCDCGGVKAVSRNNLCAGHTISCGCAKKEFAATMCSSHGAAKGGKITPELRSYYKAKERCTNPNCKDYPRYGGRGITMHGPWIKNATAFLEYMGEKPIGFTLERINNEMGYEPGNLKWASRLDQARNRRWSGRRPKA